MQPYDEYLQQKYPQYYYPSPILCWMCERMYSAMSTGGDHICPSCDCGRNPDGSRTTFREGLEKEKRFKLHKDRFEQGIDDGNTPVGEHVTDRRQ